MDKIVHLDDMQSATSDSGLDLFKARAELGIENFGLSVMLFIPNSEESYYPTHNHESDGLAETYLCVNGSGFVKFGDGEWMEFGETDFIQVDPQTTRSFRSGPNGLVLAIAAAPAEKGQPYTPPEWSQLSQSDETTKGEAETGTDAGNLTDTSDEVHKEQSVEETERTEQS